MEEGRQQRALSPCVIWTRQEYALMFPMVEISVLFLAALAGFPFWRMTGVFCVARGTRSTLISVKP